MPVVEIFSPDILIVVAIVAIMFGGTKIPQLARSLGSAKHEFEKGIAEGDGSTRQGGSDRSHEPTQPA